tara:strand:+ start:789 stop:1796 length:1008 start_codon:yes stop_codon:yes gene_type:complete
MSPLFVGAANSTNRLFGNLSSNPSSPQAGDRYYNTSTNEFRVYDGSNWVALNPTLGTSSQNPARNAAALYALGERTNGYYHIGTSGSSRLIYCVLDANFMSGGGWMIAANHDAAKTPKNGHQARLTARSDQTGSDDGSGTPATTSMIPEKSFSVNMNGVPFTKFAHVCYANSNMSSISTSNWLNPLAYYAGSYNTEKTLPTTASYKSDDFDNVGLTLQMSGSNLARRLTQGGSATWLQGFGVADANSGGTGTFRLNGSGASTANYPVWVSFRELSSGLASYTFSFTDSSGGNSTSNPSGWGWDDFQDGSGMGDDWEVEGVGDNGYRNNPSYIMLQ